MFRYVEIKPAYGGFGEYQARQDRTDDLYDTLTDALADASAEVTELVDGAQLPAGAEDIRGRIRGEPDHVFVCVDERGDCAYFGFEVVPEAAPDAAPEDGQEGLTP